MRASAAELSEADARVLEQCKVVVAEEVQYCRAMKAVAGVHWNPRNLEAALQLQRMLERDAWDVADVHRLSNEFLTGDVHEDVGFGTLRIVVGRFVDVVHRTAWKGNAGAPRGGS